jgi:methylenetetrahydrofolate dehydrogenase (NADP+)/methenyltetrahydrofolate cyclohydrolase
MRATIFDGLAFAREKEKQLKQAVSELKVTPRLLSIVFREDQSSQIYTRLKMEAAVRVGIEFDRIDVSFKDDYQKIQQIILDACKREDVHGVMIQKPAKSNWRQYANKSTITNFSDWWTILASQIDPKKDADCLTPQNLSQIYSQQSNFMPATVKAIFSILRVALESQNTSLIGKNVSVIGRSDIVGRPTAEILKQKNANVSLLGSGDDLKTYTRHADIVISATGVNNLISGEMIKEGVIVIDVGSPRGDIDFTSVSKKVGFITPVPDGVGPVTVISLLENLIQIIGNQA